MTNTHKNTHKNTHSLCPPKQKRTQTKMPPNFEVGVIKQNKDCQIMKVTVASKISDQYLKSHPSYETDRLLLHLRSKVEMKGKYPSWSFIGPLTTGKDMQSFDQSFLLCYYQEGNIAHEETYNIRVSYDSNKSIKLHCYDDILVLSLNVNCNNFGTIDYEDVIPIHLSELEHFIQNLSDGNITLCVDNDQDLKNACTQIKSSKKMSSSTLTQEESTNSNTPHNTNINTSTSKLLTYEGKLNEIMYVHSLEIEEYDYPEDIYENTTLPKPPTFLDSIKKKLYSHQNTESIWMKNRYEFSCEVLPLT